MTNTDIAQGRPWTVVGTFSTFEAASTRAELERRTRGQQVKVKQIAAGFTVRTRQETRPVEKRAEVFETEFPAAQSSSKNSKLRAKDRRVLERKNSNSITDDTEE